MKRFTYDFAGFVLGAFIGAAPVCAVVVSIFSLGARADVKNGSVASGTGHPAVGAPNALSLPGNPGLHTGESAASAHSSGHARESRRQDTAHPVVGISAPTGGASVPHAHGVRHAPGRVVNEVVLLRDARGHLSLRALATAAAELCGVPVALFHSLIHRESTWRHYDSRGRVLRSSAGALGLAQVLPSTARAMGLDARQPWQNALAGACYLRQALDRRGGDHRAALHDYHAGPWRKATAQATHDYATDIIEGSAN